MTPGIDFSNGHLFDQLTNNINGILPRLPNALFTILAGYIIIRLVSIFAYWFLGFFRMPRGLKTIIISLVDILLYVFLIIVVLQSLGLSNLALAFTAGVAALGIALGNGSVALVQDIQAGILLAKDKDFHMGDEIEIADEPGSKGVRGIVEGMDMRRTRLRDEKGYLHVFPNSYIERRAWVLITRRRDRKA
jgi:small-conductance mechanosensitive channel